MLWFIAATYNEEQEVNDLFNHVFQIVDGYRICDDSSTDDTQKILTMWADHCPKPFAFKVIKHTGLPETVKNAAKDMVPDGDWILMLDADERLTPETIDSIRDFFESEESLDYDYVYFNQFEIIDGFHVRTFQKAKLFRKEAVKFPLNNIHADDQFEGEGTFFSEWVVLHRKTSAKQKLREKEYLATYDKLFEEGKIDEGRRKWLRNLHHFVK